MNKPKQELGNPWTTDKLNRLEQYLQRYPLILRRRKHLRFAYIDAFAGTGYRVRRMPSEGEEYYVNAFQDKATQEFLKGSARIALEVEPGFHKYIFIEKHKARFRELEKLKECYPDKRERIVLVNREANEYLSEICRKSWEKRRAVLFLDPFGMQVHWETLEAIAGTEAMDVWLLFPWGVAVNRLLRRDGEISPPIRKRLDQMFGTTDWFDHFFKRKSENLLYGTREYIEKTVDLQTMKQYFLERLRTIFAGVAANPLALPNSRRCPLYLLFFAVGNPWAVRPAIKIAEHILGKRSNG